MYIIFTVADVMENLGCAEQKANKLLNELDNVRGIGLIERKRRGLGKPNVIYVKTFVSREQISPMPKESALSQSQIKSCENHKSRNVKTANQELQKSQTNDTYLNNTELSNSYQSIYLQENETDAENTIDICSSLGEDDRMDKTDSVPVANRMELFDSYYELIRDNIDYDILLQRYPYDRERLDGFVEIMAEVCSGSRGTVQPGGNEYGSGTKPLFRAGQRTYPVRDGLSGQRHYACKEYPRLYSYSFIQCACNHQPVLFQPCQT